MLEGRADTPVLEALFVAKLADMRRSHYGLLALVRGFLGEDPKPGHLYVFRNRLGN